MSEATRYDRRHFIGTAVTAIAGAGLLASRVGEPDSWSRDASGLLGTTPSATDSPGSLTQVDAGALDGRYAEAGPSNGPPAILLHRGPNGINGHVDVAPLAARGYRVILPYGHGVDTRRFASSAAPSDVMALMAALELEKALVGGCDEGAQTAEVMAAMWPQRLKAIAPINGSGVVTLAAHQRPLPPKEELAWWYRYYFLRHERG
jgi:pimeloyl-ACP methyl ester carboxylesterase